MIRVEGELRLAEPWTELRFEIVELQGREAIGQPYEFVVTAELLAEPGAPGPSVTELDAALSTTAVLTLTVFGADGKRERTRQIHAMVDRIEAPLAATLTSNRALSFTFVLRPRFFELERFVTQDIFVGNIPTVIANKLALAGWAEPQFELRLKNEAVYVDKDGASGELEQGRLMVQYRESDLAFVSRLAEHVGISFYFESEDAEERVIFTDFDGGFAAREAPVRMAESGAPGIVDVRRKLSNVKSEFFEYDYNYRTPHLNFQRDGELLFDVLGGSASLDVTSAGALVDYASNVKTPAEAEFLAQRRAEEEEAQREIFELTVSDPTLAAGQRFSISGHAEFAEDAEFVVVSLVHRYRAESSFLQRGPRRGATPSAEREEPPYHATLTAVRANKTSARGVVMAYRPPRKTLKPRISGVVTGIVQSALPGQAESRQHIDREGRYLVKLHFDQGPKTMPRLRMAQPSAGAGYGQHFPLRPGAEVLIAFLDGDPDRPVIVGALPNPLQRSPVTTPRDLEPPEVNRIRTQSGVVFEIGDGLSQPD